MKYILEEEDGSIRVFTTSYGSRVVTKEEVDKFPKILVEGEEYILLDEYRLSYIDYCSRIENMLNRIARKIITWWSGETSYGTREEFLNLDGFIANEMIDEKLY